MPKLQTLTTNFTAGEFSPRLRGRVDLEKYNASAEKLENCVVLRQGGATIRPSFDWKGEIKSSSQTARIIPFVFSRVDAFLLEFGNLYMRVWKNGALVESSPGVPYELVTPWTQAQLASIDFTQGADTLIVAHPDVAPRRILRFEDAKWSINEIRFTSPALYEAGHRETSITMTVSATSVGTPRTLTASAGFFLAADLNRYISWGTGRALINSLVSATEATVEIVQAFNVSSADSPDWLLEGTAQTAIDPSAASPIGSTITITSTTNGFRAQDVGRYIDINGGLVQVQSITTASEISAVIKRALGNAEAVGAGGWSMLDSAWNGRDGYPATCTLFQQRLWFGGTEKFPQTQWGSKTAVFFDFTPGQNDDDAVYKTIDSDDINVLQFLSSLGALVALTYGGEFDTRGGIEKPITQTNAQITMRSRWGCEQVRPEHAGRDLLFVQRGGRALRAMSRNDLETLDTQDISVFSEHLLRNGAKSIAWEQSPEQVCWIAAGDGKLIALTYSAEQNVFAFTSGQTDGVIEWLASIPEGPIDATYALVRRTINGATKRYIERLNWEAPPGQDSRREVTLGVAATTFTGFGHLAGKTVVLLADDVFVGTAVVSLSGEIVAPRAALKLSAGLPYTATIRMQSPEVGTGTGTSQGQAQSTNQVLVRFLETTGCKVNGQEIAFREFGDGILDQPPPVFSGFKDITEYGWGRESPLELVQDQPYPWTILAVVRQFTVNPG